MCNGLPKEMRRVRADATPASWAVRVLRASRRALAVSAMRLVAQAAHAQLPRVQLPNLPQVDLPTVTQTVTGTVDGVTDRLGVDRLADLRQLRIRELLRTQRANVERDPSGAPILRAEIVAFSPT